MYTEQMTQGLSLADQIFPANYAAATYNSNGLDMQKFHRALFVLEIGVMADALALPWGRRGHHATRRTRARGCRRVRAACCVSAGSPSSGQKRISCCGISRASKGRQRAVAAGVERNRMAIAGVQERVVTARQEMEREPEDGVSEQSKTGRCSDLSSGADSILPVRSMQSTMAETSSG